MRRLKIWEFDEVKGGYGLAEHNYSFAIANMLTFAGISSLLSLGLGEEVFIGAMLAEAIYGSTMYYLSQSSPDPSQEIFPQKRALPSIVSAHAI